MVGYLINFYVTVATLREGMTTTDTTKNQCYVVAKKMAERCAPEEYCVALGKQFLDNYPLISAVEVGPCIYCRGWVGGG